MGTYIFRRCTRSLVSLSIPSTRCLVPTYLYLLKKISRLHQQWCEVDVTFLKIEFLYLIEFLIG